MILERQLSYKPEDDVSNEAKDLIDRLLQLEPSQRLGAGDKGAKNDYDALKEHPFFKGISFPEANSAKIHVEKRPVEEVVLPTTDKHKESPSSGKEEKTGEVKVVHEGDLKKRNPYFMN